MILNFILLFIIIIAIFLLYKQVKKPDVDYVAIIPSCKFHISNPKFEIDKTTRIAKYSVYSKNKNRFFRDFPIGFKFYSNDKFRSKIKISYTIPDDEEIEIIYDRVVEFEDTAKEHIYYINDSIIGTINFEIYTESQYGKPSIKFEILQNNLCHMEQEHSLEIIFPK